MYVLEALSLIGPYSIYTPRLYCMVQGGLGPDPDVKSAICFYK